MEKEIIFKRMDSVVFLKEYFTPLLALIAGLLSFKHFDFFWKFLFLQLVLYVLTIKIVYFLTPGLQTNDNHWFYNGYIILEIGLLCFAPYFKFKSTFIRSTLFLLFAFYILVFIFQGYRNGFEHFTNFAFATAGFILTLIYSYVLYLEFQNKNSYWLKSPAIWASVGLILYFACNVPYFSLFNYLNQNYPHESRFLFNFITDVLANIRYLLLAVAFFLLRKNSIAQQIKLS